MKEEYNNFWTLCLMACALFFSACSSDNDKLTGREVRMDEAVKAEGAGLSPADARAMLSDILVFQEYVKIDSVTTPAHQDSLYKTFYEVLRKKYHIDSAQFREVFNYYYSNIDTLNYLLRGLKDDIQ